MHHADTLVHGIQRRSDVHLFSVQTNLTLEATGAVNNRHTEQDVHQGGLTCTIFTQQGVDLARLYRKRNITQYGIIAVVLRDLFHFQNEFVLHVSPFLLIYSNIQ